MDADTPVALRLDGALVAEFSVLLRSITALRPPSIAMTEWAYRRMDRM
jgi:hypothetical protein